MAYLKISPDFFKTEVREGFPVGELMKRNWAAQMQVLEDVRELCERHNIRWFAYAGTLLGAVRHKGFVPWDDDVDIFLLGEDFVNFLYYAKAELDDKYILLSPYGADDWELRSIARLVNSRHINFSNEYLDKWHNCPLAFGTDVFPFYYVPRDKEKDEFICNILSQIGTLNEVNDYNIKLISEGRFEESKEINQILAENMAELQRITGFEFTPDRKLSNQLAQIFDAVCRLTDEDEADYVTRYNVYPRYRDYKYPKSMFEETVMLPFENIMVPAPKDYDGFLKMKYGDYMKPKKFTQIHDYPYFQDQIRVIQTKVEILDWAAKRGETKSLDLKMPKKVPLSESKNEKCVVLYYTSVREMVIYGEYVINKIKDLIEYFKKNSDRLSLWWCPGAFPEHGNTVGEFDRIVPELMENYQKLIDEYKASGIGICDESGDLNKAIDSCDMYYGDEGFLSDLFGNSGKPVYIQDYHELWNEKTEG